jgi:hypothetical protein
MRKPCGCIPGRFLCPTAADLWRKTRAYHRVAQMTGDYSLYEKTMREYKEHHEENLTADTGQTTRGIGLPAEADTQIPLDRR